MLKTLDLFTGIGGITHALRGLATPVMYCEKDPECREVLENLMKHKKIPRAPVHADVTKLTAAHLPAGVKLDMIAAGSPCVGFSHGGHHEGLNHPGSGLFMQVIRIAKSLKPPLLFFENVEGILANNDIATVVNSIRGIGYDMWWVVIPAYAVGAHQKRSRWFCLAVRRGLGKVVIRPSEPFTRFSWSAEPLVRLIPGPTLANRRRMRMLGNSVVPDCVRAAFLSLWTGCTTPIPKLMRLSSSIAKTPLVLDPPKPMGPLPKSDTKAFACVVGPEGAWKRIRRPPGLLERPTLGLVLDPKSYSPPKGYDPNETEKTSGLVHKARPMGLWSTPRASNGTYAMQVLTERGSRDLGTQLRFERRTPKHQRGGATNPDWGEWLMGFPRGWTDLASRKP